MNIPKAKFKLGDRVRHIGENSEYIVFSSSCMVIGSRVDSVVYDLLPEVDELSDFRVAVKNLQRNVYEEYLEEVTKK